MRRFRRIIFWCHLPIGVTAGVVILVMCVTGVLMSYEKQITSWADTKGYQSTPPASDAKHLPVEALLAKAREVRGAMPTAVTLKSDATAPAEIAFGRETTLFVNPFTGAILGEGSQLRSILRFAHTGEVVGVAGQTIAALVSAGGAMLVITGLALAIRRLLAWLGRRSKSPQPSLVDAAEPITSFTGD